MNSFVDPSVHPCEDLYKHSCGYWLGKTSTPSSFMADVAENYSRLLHNVLSSGGAEGIGVQAGALRYVSRYYSSCMEFLGKKHTVEEIVTPFLQHMNITVKTWLGTRDRLAIFNDLVGYSVRFKLHSFFVIEMTEHLNSTPTWSTERGWAFMERVSGLAAVDSGGQDRATAYLRSVLKAIDASASTEATTSRVVELDLKRATVPSESGDSHEDHYTALGKLTCDIFEGAAWLKALQAVPGDTEKLTAQTMVHASSVEVICDELSAALRDSNPVVGPIYSLALMAAEVLRYHFALPAEDAGPAKLHAICYGATWKPFSRAWVEILSAFLGMGAHAEEFMKAYFKSITSSMDTYMDWMADTDQAKVEQKFRSYGLIGMDAPQLDVQKLRCSRYDGSIELSKDDFIYNRIMVYGYIAKDCVVPKRPLSKSVLSYLEGTELVVDSPSKVVVVPHMFGLPPLYYVQMKEDYVNYALGGTVLARKFFRVVLNGSWKKSTTEKMLTARDCYAKLSSRFHDALSEDRFHEVFSTAEAQPLHRTRGGERHPEVLRGTQLPTRRPAPVDWL
ncbi:uncharacterized protein [Dermacentor albipictus]|uniref:uncharacterized protein isoform X2 n=1 Tax=Dermacentor albipictus TaxID=60249 RepID=UPI0031FD5552